MNKLQSEVHNLLRYEHSARDTEILQGLAQFGTITKLVKNTEFKKRTVERRLAAMRKSAERFGFQQEFPETSIVTDMPAYGRSVLQKYPEGSRSDGAVMVWHKTKSEDVTLAHAIKSVIEGLQVEPLKRKKAHVKATSDVLPILTITDAHLGLLAYEPETGADWDQDQMERLLYNAIDYLVDKMDHVDQALLAEAGDMTHTDGLISKTPKSGNPLDSSDRYFSQCRAAGRVMRYAIEALLTKANNVQVISVRGNHNDQTSWQINEQMKILYSNEPRVDVMTNDSYHLPYVWRDNFIVVTHGDAAKNAKMYQYVTTKWPEEFGKAKYTYILKGHVHHTRQEAIGNMMFETFSTLTKSDAYHEFKMYKSARSMSLVNLHPEGGEDSRSTFIPRF